MIDHGKEEPTDLFEVHLQRWYNDTPIEVRIDNTQIFNDTVTTGYILALAKIIPFNINKGTHTLSVKIADSISSETTFTISDTLYIAVNYNSTTSEIAFIIQKNPFYYR